MICGIPLAIHWLRQTTDTVVRLRGRLVWEYYDELERICTETIEHNRKQLNAYRLKAERVEPFNKLLALMEENKHKNQYQYQYQ